MPELLRDRFRGYMRRYLIIKHFLKGTYTTHVISRDDLVKNKNKEIDLIIDTEKCTFFDSESNSWKELPKE